MRRIVLWLAATVTVVVLLLGYHTSTNTTSAVAVAASTPSPSGTPSSSSTPSPSPGSASATKTYTGSVAQTRWGPVQVEVTVTAGKLTTVTVLQQPNGNPKDEEINAYALPILDQETLSAQSANIDMVSGATVTSDGYLQSLQSALDEAGI